VALVVPYFRRDDVRKDLLAQLRAAEAPEDLYSADPRVEEAIERSILPSWDDAVAALKSSRSKVKNSLVGEWGFPNRARPR
jgi:hypothetical protein